MPILMTCLGYGVFCVGDTTMKMLALKFHFSQVIAFNCTIIIACMAAYGALTQGKKAFRFLQPRLVVLRGALSVVVAALNIYAFIHVHLSTFYTLIFTAPFWVALLSSVFLKEKLHMRQAAVILAGFSVVVFIFQPGSGLLNLGGVAALTSAFVYAASMVVMRKLGPKESRVVIVITGSCCGLLFSLPMLPFHFIQPTMHDLGIFLATGIMGALGVTCIAYAFQNAPSAAVIAPYHYTQIFWGTLLGWAAFHEVPEARTMVGAALIIAAGLALIYSEARQKKRMALLRAGGG